MTATAQRQDDNALLAAVLAMQGDMAAVKATMPMIQSDISEIKLSIDKRICGLEDRLRIVEEYRLRTDGSLGLIKWALGGGILGIIALIGLIITIVNNSLLP